MIKKSIVLTSLVGVLSLTVLTGCMDAAKSTMSSFGEETNYIKSTTKKVVSNIVLGENADDAKILEVVTAECKKNVAKLELNEMIAQPVLEGCITNSVEQVKENLKVSN